MEYNPTIHQRFCVCLYIVCVLIFHCHPVFNRIIKCAWVVLGVLAVEEEEEEEDKMDFTGNLTMGTPQYS